MDPEDICSEHNSCFYPLVDEVRTFSIVLLCMASMHMAGSKHFHRVPCMRPVRWCVGYFGKPLARRTRAAQTVTDSVVAFGPTPSSAHYAHHDRGALCLRHGVG